MIALGPVAASQLGEVLVLHLYRLRYELVTSVSLREAFDLFQSPSALERLFPASFGLTVRASEQGGLRAGGGLVYQFCVSGLEFCCRTEITEYEAPFYFVERACEGPFKFWHHRHTFRPTMEGTVVRDEIEYALPYGPAGRLAHAMGLSRRIRQAFTHRQAEATKLLGGRAAHFGELVGAGR